MPATRSGLTGSFIRAIVDAPRTGGADYGLIDFGTQSMPLSFIGDTPITDDHPQPRVGQSVCHIGVSSGQHCGQVAASQGEDQYLTTGMPASVPGDSGGPVWTQSAKVAHTSSESGLGKKPAPLVRNTADLAHWPRACKCSTKAEAPLKCPATVGLRLTSPQRSG